MIASRRYWRVAAGTEVLQLYDSEPLFAGRIWNSSSPHSLCHSYLKFACHFVMSRDKLNLIRKKKIAV